MPASFEPPVVLVVDDAESARRLVRIGLELEGITVVEAETLARARQFLRAGMAGVVLDRELPDGDGLTLLADIGATCPEANVVVNSTIEDGREPGWVTKVDKGDVPSIVAGLDLVAAPAQESSLAVVDLVRAEVESVVADWEELCRWDPLLPPDSVPQLSRVVVDAVADALQRPQPLGWGADPALRSAMELFATSAGPVDVAVEQLICLREAFRRHLAGQVPPAEEPESVARVDMLIDRAIWTASRMAAARVPRPRAHDLMTGLPDRGAFDADIERELERADRYGRNLTLMVIGRASSEAMEAGEVARIGAGLSTSVRAQDGVYRLAPALVGVLLPETSAAGGTALAERLAPRLEQDVLTGAATFPDDGDDVTSLILEAEHRHAAAATVGA